MDRVGRSADSVFVAKSQKGFLAREALMDAASELIADHGLGGYSIGELCAKAGLKRTSFYTYFQTMDELVDQLAEREDNVYDAGVEAMFGKLAPGLDRFAFSVLYFFLLAEAGENVGWNRGAIELLTSHPPTWKRAIVALREDLDAAMSEKMITLSDEEADALVQMTLATITGTKSVLQTEVLAPGSGLRVVSMLLRAAGTRESLNRKIINKAEQAANNQAIQSG